MEIDTLIYLCRCITKTFSLSTRIYRDGESIYYYSVTHLHPDPASNEKQTIIESKAAAGVLTTRLYQLYGFLKLDNGLCIVVGPTSAVWESERMIDEFLFLLGVSADEKVEYLRRLNCAPEIPPDRMAWMTALLATSVYGEPFATGAVEILSGGVAMPQRDMTTDVLARWESEDEQTRATVVESFRVEQYIQHLIEQGEEEQMRELLDSFPRIVGGPMASNSMRQAKNEMICAATLVTRAAIKGGMDMQAALRLSDVYIQKSELSQSEAEVLQLNNDCMLDFTRRVKELRHGITAHSALVDECVLYISHHLFERISVEEMARALHLSRTYLCTRFKQEAGVGLSDYIARVKTAEACRLLKFTERSIAEIGLQLAYSSQSHFQNAFKKETGMTPMQFRRAKSEVVN